MSYENVEVGIGVYIASFEALNRVKIGMVYTKLDSFCLTPSKLGIMQSNLGIIR